MISKKEVQHIANLARIGVDEKELGKFSKDLSAILDWMEELKKAEISNTDSADDINERKNKTREDKISGFDNIAEIKKLFPEEKNGYDKVKSVL